jgi:hypothetical protein
MAAEEELAQGLVRRRVAKRPSDNAAWSSPALVSPMMEPMLTKPSPEAFSPCRGRWAHRCRVADI